jgi:hypothetical protein
MVSQFRGDLGSSLAPADVLAFGNPAMKLGPTPGRDSSLPAVT